MPTNSAIVRQSGGAEAQTSDFSSSKLPDLFYAIGLPPEKAIEYFKSKGYTFSWDWWDTWQEAHTKAFTVAKVMRMDILQDIRDMIQKSLDDGITFQQFKKELEPRLKAKGWWGKKMIMDADGKASEVQLGSPYRLKTIYQTNLQTAYNAGRWKGQMDNVDNRPYLQYVAILDSRTRPQHRALHGKVFKYDDPFWNTHYPPLGFRCRCRVRALTTEQAEKAGISKSKGHITWKDELVSKKTGELQPVAVYRDPLTGEKIATDVGWSYNPAKAWLNPFTPKPLDPREFEGGYKTVGAAFHKKTPVEKLPAKTLTEDMLLSLHQSRKGTKQEKEMFNQFLKSFNTEMGKPVVFKDVLNDPVIISEDLFIKADREIYLPMLADTIKDPVEIWLTWVQGKNKTRLCKRYIGVYKDAKGKVSYAIFDLMNDAWKGTTTFQVESLDYLDRQRVGKLLYAK